MIATTTIILLALTAYDVGPASTWLANVTTESPAETAIIDRALACDRSQTPAPRQILRDILRIEESAGVPAQLRGMVLAAACHESGLSPEADGDCKCRGVRGLHQRPVTCDDGKTCTWRAVGLLQQWPWVERYGVDRRDPLEAAAFWLAHVVSRVAVVQDECNIPPAEVDRLWRTAWVTAVRAPSESPRCRERPRHWRRFVRWRAEWSKKLRRVTK